MNFVDSLKPHESKRVIDLVAAAGVNVTPWGVSSKGKVKVPASNPAYCYEWAFTETDKLVVLNVWHRDLKERNGLVTCDINPRAWAENVIHSNVLQASERGTLSKRALRMDQAIATANMYGLPVRVIIGEGSQRNLSEPKSKASRMTVRLLDPEPWTVARYNKRTGDCHLVRGNIPHNVDHFATAELRFPVRVLFARVGWMTYYAGPQEGDERPKGGGRYTKKNVGNEVFNFVEFDGRLYGFARAKSGRVKLTRIDPDANEAERLGDVLVIFVARQCIVGWYRTATVYAAIRRKYPAAAKRELSRRLKQFGMKGFELWGYQFEADAKGATLLQTYERKHKVAGAVKGGFGESNIRYFFQTSKKTKDSAWMHDAIQYVLNYNRANLLDDRDAELNSEEATMVAQEQAAGFQSDPKIRKTIEQHAMKEAQKALEGRGFSKFENTSATKPYDFTCWRKAKKLFVEVKGTQTLGKSVVLTKNEVQHVKSHQDNCVLVIVHSIKLTGKRVASAGTPVVTEKWDLTHGELTATQYLWKI